jgi:hypothetical protein
MPREEHEGGGIHDIESQTRIPLHSRSSKSQRKHNNHHKEAADGVAEDEAGEAKQIVQDPHNQMLPPSTLCPRLCKKQRIEVEEVDGADVEVGGVAEGEVAQSMPHSVWLLVAVNLVGN